MMLNFKIEQIALAPTNSKAAKDLLALIGIGDWVEDQVTAEGSVYHEHGLTNKANLSFNYSALNEARELEVLDYVEGKNWVAESAFQHRHVWHTGMVSHFGMHVTEDELDRWKVLLLSRGIGIAQEVHTKSHTNPFLAQQKRKYHYCIFDTRAIIGVDLKFIVRIQPSDESVNP